MTKHHRAKMNHLCYHQMNNHLNRIELHNKQKAEQQQAQEYRQPENKKKAGKKKKNEKGQEQPAEEIGYGLLTFDEIQEYREEYPCLKKILKGRLKKINKEQKAAYVDQEPSSMSKSISAQSLFRHHNGSPENLKSS